MTAGERRPAPGQADRAALRQCVLATVVLEDVDLLPADDGARLPAGLLLRWDVLAALVAPHPPGSSAARRRLAGAVRVATQLGLAGPAPHNPASAGSLARAHAVTPDGRPLRDAARLVALPEGHECHPGGAWVRSSVLGGVLDAGVGIAEAEEPGAVTPLHPALAALLGIEVGVLWVAAAAHAERMAALVTQRLRRDGLDSRGPRTAGDASQPEGRQGSTLVLRPMGGCDVLALLATRAMRSYLAASDGTGMRTVAAPARTRGWFDVARIDPAFVAAAWEATAQPDRGVRAPLLVTADEVAVPHGRHEDVVRSSLDLPAPWWRRTPSPGRHRPGYGPGTSGR